MHITGRSPLLLFLPLASPGLASVALGSYAVTKGLYSDLQIGSIIVGLCVLTGAGIFTSRSHVVKVWKDVAAGEKRRGDTAVLDLADATKTHAAELAEFKVATAAQITELQHAAEVERSARELALQELSVAKARTDLTPALDLLHQIVGLISSTKGASE